VIGSGVTSLMNYGYSFIRLVRTSAPYLVLKF
jgi:hypothetical protein